MFPIFNLGPFAVQSKGFILLIGTYLSLMLMNRYGKKVYSTDDRIENLIIITIIGGIVGARFGFFLQNFNIFKDNLVEIFSFNSAMLNVEFGILTSIVLAIVYGQRRNLLNWKSMDVISVFIVSILPIYHFSNFASGSDYGIPTNSTWIMTNLGIGLHPIQLYETLGGILILFSLVVRTRALSKKAFSIDGLQFLIVLGLNILLRHMLKPLYAQSPLMLNQIHINQIATWFSMLMISILILKRLNSKIKQEY